MNTRPLVPANGTSRPFQSKGAENEARMRSPILRPFFKRQVEHLLSQIHFQNYKFSLIKAGARWYIQAAYPEDDVYTGLPALQFTRKWYISEYATDSEIVQTVFKCCLTSMEHRTREEFTYKGARVYGPHFDVEDLVQLCKTRENAGGRK